MSYQDHPLQIRVVPSRAIYTDNNSGADMNVAIYEPIFPEDGDWYFLGHLAVTLPGGHHSIDDPLLAKLAPQTIVVRSDDPTALCAVTPDQKLWTDQHSGGSQDIEIYSFRGNPTWNYTDMGLFASIVHDYGADPQQTPNWNKLRAVRNDLVGGYGIELSSLTRAYRDSGSKAHGKGIWEDMSIWNVPGFSRGLHPQTFMLSQGYDAPPNSVTPQPCWLQPSAVRFVGNAVWMAENTVLHDRKLRDICLPATHDSGTFALTDVMDDDGWKGPLDKLLDVLNEIAEKIRDIPGIGHFLDDLDPLTWIFTNAVMPTIHATSTSTRRSVLQQLWDGIRGFDFRVYYHENDFYVGHGGVIGPKLSDLFKDIAGFLETTEGEIVYMTMGHWTHFDADKHTRFANLVQEHLGSYACRRQAFGGWGQSVATDVFDRTYQQIVSVDGRPQSRVILVYDLGPDNTSYGVANRDIFWPITYSPPSSGIGEKPPYQLPGIYGFYTATTDKDEMLSKQKEQYQIARANNFPFALYTTLTPSTFDTILRVIVSLKESFFLLSILPTSWSVAGILDILGITSEMIDAALPWRTLEELTQRVSPDLDALVNNNFVDKSGDNAISLLYLDYYENTKVVDLAIKLSRQNAPVQLAIPIPAASDMSYKLPYDFYWNTVTYQYSSGRVWLCQNPDGTGDVFADDCITLSVVGPNGNTQTYTYDYSHNNSGWVAPQPPTDVTYLFMPGKNTVTIKLTDLFHNSRGCSSFYLVHESV